MFPSKYFSSPAVEGEERYELDAPVMLAAEQLDEVGGGTATNGGVIKWLGGPSDAQLVEVKGLTYHYEVFGNR